MFGVSILLNLRIIDTNITLICELFKTRTKIFYQEQIYSCAGSIMWLSEGALLDEGGDALDDSVFFVVVGVIFSLDVDAEHASESLPECCAE